MRFGCPRVAARHKRAYLGKENPFAEHKDVAGDTRQGSRSAAGSDWMDHKAEHRSILLIRPLHPLRLTTFGREIAGLLWSGQGGFSAKRGFILPILEKGVYTSYTQRVHDTSLSSTEKCLSLISTPSRLSLFRSSLGNFHQFSIRPQDPFTTARMPFRAIPVHTGRDTKGAVND
jgi:hypothetical protein